MEAERKVMRVMVATPAYTGEVSVHYVVSLIETIKLGLSKGVEVIPVYFPNEAIIGRARNNLLRIAYGARGLDGVFWIDDDTVWKAEDFFKILETGKDYVSGLCPQKNEQRIFCYREKAGKKVDANTHLLEVESVGLGFCFMSTACINALWRAGVKTNDTGIESRIVFHVEYTYKGYISEDIRAAQVWKKPIYVHADVVCGHVGTKVY